ncbi:Hypothetical predicted protein, partial [Scomber scombrus]
NKGITSLVALLLRHTEAICSHEIGQKEKIVQSFSSITDEGELLSLEATATREDDFLSDITETCCGLTSSCSSFLSVEQKHVFVNLKPAVVSSHLSLNVITLYT